MVLIHDHGRLVGRYLDLILRKTLYVVVPGRELLFLPIKDARVQKTQVTLLLLLILHLTDPCKLVQHGSLVRAAFRLLKEFIDELVLTLLRVYLIEHGEGRRGQRLVAQLSGLQRHIHVFEA